MRSRKTLPVLAVSAQAEPFPAFPVPQASGEDDAAPGLSMQQVIAILRAHWKHTLMIALTLIVITVVVVKSLPKTYTATATLMVRSQQHDPLEGTPTQSEPLGTYMATETQLMQEPGVLLPVIDKLGLTKDRHYTAGYRGDGSDLREWVKERLAKDLDIEPGPFGSQLIFVTAAARNPVLAARIANTVSDVYLTQERSRVSGPASDRAKRYAAELVELKNKVRLAQDQVTAFRQRTGLTDPGVQNSHIDVTLLATLETRLQDAQNARRAAEVQAAMAPGVSADAAKSQTIQTLKGQIASEEAELAQLRATLGPRHPKVIEIENQIAANRRSLAAEGQNLSADASANLAAARDLEAKMQAAVAQQRAKVLATSRLEAEGTKYVLELESAQSVYKRALDGYDQIMFASDSPFAHVAMVSRAVPPQSASRPNKVKLALAGVFAGLILGIALPGAYELLINRRVRCRDDFERAFGVPVLIEFDAFAPTGEAS